MVVHFFNSITLLGLFIILVLTVFFSVTKKGEKSGNRLMVVLLILFGIQILYSYTISAYTFQYFMKWHKPLFLLRQTAFLVGPLIYLYYQVYIKKMQIKPFHFLHAMPFIGMLMLLLFSYPAIHNFVIWRSRLDLYDTILILAQSIVYIIIILNSYRTFNNSISGILNNLKTSSFIGWLQLILLGFFILWVINLNMFATYMILKKPQWCAYTGSIYALIFFLFLSSVMLILLLKPEIYYLIEKYKNYPVNEDVKIKYRQSIIDYMNIRKPYLEPEISLEDIAKDISINARLLSQIINQSFRKNFNGYMNEFRINEALQQLSDIRNKKTVQEIVFDSGFNSLSVFYTEFKKQTGLTPQEYKKSQNK